MEILFKKDREITCAVFTCVVYTTLAIKQLWRETWLDGKNVIMKNWKCSDTCVKHVLYELLLAYLFQ